MALYCSSPALAENGFHAGPIFDEFSLTLDSGHRTEILGPLFYDQQRESEKTWAVVPLMSYDIDPATDTKEFDLLYPILTYERFGMEYRWQLVQLISFSGGEVPEDTQAHRFTIFPLYFQQRSPDPKKNYTAVVPFYGHLQDHLFRDEIYFVLFPLYSETRKRDIVTDNYLFPIFHLRHGNGMQGWQAWPLVGNEHKDVTTLTNGFGDTEVVGGYDHFFALWPVFFRQNNGIGTENVEKFRAALPFYAGDRSPKRDSTTVLWPLFNWIDDRDKKYREWELPYPVVIIARGPGKTTTRVFPLCSWSHNDTLESDFFMWPFYKYRRLHADTLDRQRIRILFYLYQNTVETNLETGAARKRVDFWPLFVWQRDFDGNRRFQALALVETALTAERIERNWSPLWSVWRSEYNPRAGAASQSLLWNLYRRDTTPASRKCSLLFGFFQYQSDSKMKKLRLFYVPVFRWHASAGEPAK